MIYVYAMESLKKRRIYVGQTNDLKRRVQEHNAGRTKTTKYFRPWRLFYYEEHPDRKTAREKEKYLKSGTGKEFLKNIAPVAQRIEQGSPKALVGVQFLPGAFYLRKRFFEAEGESASA